MLLIREDTDRIASYTVIMLTLVYYANIKVTVARVTQEGDMIINAVFANPALASRCGRLTIHVKATSLFSGNWHNWWKQLLTLHVTGLFVARIRDKIFFLLSRRFSIDILLICSELRKCERQGPAGERRRNVGQFIPDQLHCSPKTMRYGFNPRYKGWGEFNTTSLSKSIFQGLLRVVLRTSNPMAECGYSIHGNNVFLALVCMSWDCNFDCCTKMDCHHDRCTRCHFYSVFIGRRHRYKQPFSFLFAS